MTARFSVAMARSRVSPTRDATSIAVWHARSAAERSRFSNMATA